MPNFLQRLVVRPLRGSLVDAARQLWDQENISDNSDEDLWRDLGVIGKGSPVLAAYEDSYRGWYLAFADGGETQCIFLQPVPEFDPDAGWSVPEALVERIVPYLARALGAYERDLLDEIEGGGTLYLNGRTLEDTESWKRVCDALSSVGQSIPPVTLSDRANGACRWTWINGRAQRVTHRPEPLGRWLELQKLGPWTDPEGLFRTMVFGEGSDVVVADRGPLA